VDALLFFPRGDLPRDAFAATTRHLAGCPPCRAALREVQATYRLLQRHLNVAPAGSAPLLPRRRPALAHEPEPEPVPVPVRLRPAPAGLSDPGWWRRAGRSG
jgi:anti-sigma factor RsiW